MVLIATQVKRRRGTTAENDAFTGAEGEITVDTEKHQLRVHDGTTQGGFVIGSGGSGRNIGDIFYTTRKDTELAGAVECDGATYNTTDFTGNGSIGELLEAGKLPYVSLTDYATQITNNGVCGVFGWDGTGTTTFRVPKLQDVFVECGQASQLGDYISAGLPNITGYIRMNNTYGDTASASGSFAYENPGNSQFIGTNSQTGSATKFNFDASTSSSIYGNSTTVQPKSVKYRAMIQIANGATDEALETCTGVLADVAGLKDRDYVVEKQDPTAENGYTWYRKYKNGWVEQGGICAPIYTGTTVSFPITMANTNYQFQLSIGQGKLTGTVGTVVDNRTTTGMTVYTNYSTVQPNYICWQVAGKSAQ